MAHVLVPTDGSEQAAAALEYAFDLFPEGDITVLSVVEVTTFPDDPRKTPTEAAEDHAEEALQTAQDLAEEHGRSVYTATVHQSAASGIIDYTEDNDIDHIVMGSKGQSGLTRILLGSVAETVVRRAPVPVTVVR